ncbi:LexA/Signal peptidase [Plenodomus tracheiphilus IPT5]|uniref:Mitochondrial inner membrane protease subunit n=1 Tax=Plenodomus tracheiphilus IPT5 TaxID=1408161 RepID=A0A6A7B3C8_9PLEO|nr:LexA/Signal peptidase [Plenodomus tracheiphilus IPT5]
MIFIRDHFIDYQHVKGVSMAPTLNPRAHETGEEDSVIMVAWHAGVEQRRRRRKASNSESAARESVEGQGATDEDSDGIKRGDVVTFWKPHRPSEISIKRVVGLPGDVVYPARGYALDAEHYVRRLKGLPDGLVDGDEDAVLGSDEVGKVVVPYGHLWIEGDNWRRSLDSNDFGPISKGLVIGKARWLWRGWWPFGEVGDARSKGERSGTRVVEGRAEVPGRFLD